MGIAGNGELVKRRMKVIGAALVCMLAAGCAERQPTWSSQVGAPDGGWVAEAHTMKDTSGRHSVETVVELKRRLDSRRSAKVLSFTDDGAAMGLQMTWPEPNHLQVTFRDSPAVLSYHVAKTMGVDVSVRNLAGPQGSGTP